MSKPTESDDTTPVDTTIPDPPPPPLQYGGVHWNPMAVFGEQLIRDWGASPLILFFILQLGGALGGYVFTRIMIETLSVFAPLFEVVSIPIQGVRGIIYLVMFLGTPFCSYLLWRNMRREATRRFWDDFVFRGKRPQMFQHNKRAQRMRQQVLERHTKEVRRKERLARRKPRPHH